MAKTIGGLTTSLTAAQIADNDDALLAVEHLSTSKKMTLTEFRKAAVDVANVRDYGAVGDGVTDDTAAIQAAIAAAQATIDGSIIRGAVVEIPQGVYLVKSTLTIYGGIQLRGAAKRGSVLNFAPTADDVCIEINGADQDGNNVVANLEIRSTTTGYDKTAIHIVDTSECLIDNVFVRFADVADNLDDIGLLVAGRQSLTVRDTTIYAPVPIYILNDGTGTITHTDNANFDNLYLISTPAPDTLTRACVLIGATTQASWISFTGRQAWAKGDYGVYWPCNVTEGTAPSLSLSNVRWEQGTSSSGYGYYIAATSGVPFISMRHCRSSAEAGGLYARNCRISAADSRFNRGSGAVADSINVEDVSLSLTNCAIASDGSLQFGSGAKQTLKTTTGATENTISGNIPVNGTWSYPTATATSPQFGMLEGVGRFGAKYTIADDYRHAIALTQANGVIVGILHVMAFDASKTVVAAGVFAIWDGNLDGTNRGAKKIAGTDSITNTPNSDGYLNVYTGAASLGTLYVQNKLGTTVTAVVTADFVSTDQELGNDFIYNTAIT